MVWSWFTSWVNYFIFGWLDITLKPLISKVIGMIDNKLVYYTGIQGMTKLKLHITLAGACSCYIGYSIGWTPITLVGLLSVTSPGLL